MLTFYFNKGALPSLATRSRAAHGSMSEASRVPWRCKQAAEGFTRPACALPLLHRAGREDGPRTTAMAQPRWAQKGRPRGLSRGQLGEHL